ncbi:hypothetical protein H0H93_015660 [Arthromyces matolae]|nr:hypothetical protein H0H93_015660 [Arthromyces matolae]
MKDRIPRVYRAQTLLDLGQEFLNEVTGHGEEADKKYLKGWQLKIMAGVMAVSTKKDPYVKEAAYILYLAREAESEAPDGSYVRKSLHALIQYLTKIATDKGIKLVNTDGDLVTQRKREGDSVESTERRSSVQQL